MADDAASPEGKARESTPETEPVEASEPDGAVAESDSTAIAADQSDQSIADEVDEGAADKADEDSADYEKESAPARPPMSHVRLALIAALVAVVALAGLTGWMGYRAYNSYHGEKQRELFLQVGRQGALNLTTINWEHAEADVQRVLDSATGKFYDDFQNRAAPFIEVVKQAQSKSEGSISEAGLESASSEEAQVLVAVTVNTTNVGAPQQEPRAWRMRLTVTKVGDEAKVSNVEFVP